MREKPDVRAPGRPSRGFRRLSVLAVVVTYLLIVVGGVVRVSGSGEGCGAGDGTDSWPLCHGGLVPPADLATLIEFSHRLFATLSGLALLGVMVWALVAYRHHRWLATWAVVAEVLWLVQILLGAAVIELHLNPNLILIHLANAELVLASSVVVAVLAFTTGTDRVVAWKLPGAAARLGALLAMATYVLVLSGALVVDQGASFGCNGWPLCGSGGLGFSVPAHTVDVINITHRFVAGAVVLAIGGLVPQIAKRHRGEPGIKPVMMLANIALVLQVLAGALVVETRVAPWAQGTHVAFASLLWVSVFTLATLARIRPAADVEQSLAGRHPATAVVT